MKFQIIASIAVLSISSFSFAEDMSKNNAPSSQVVSPSSGTGIMSQDSAGDPMRTPSSETQLSPKDVCKKLVDIEKTQLNQKTNQLEQFVIHGHARHMEGTSKNWLKQEIGQADCQSETIAGNHAFVVTKSGDRERILPFVKQDNMWKLDMPSYRSFYRMDARTPASKQ